MIIKVTTNNIERKQELPINNNLAQEWLSLILDRFDIQGNIFGVSFDGGSNYGVFLGGKPYVSPVDLSSVETDPLTNDLISFKIDLSDNSIRTKVYYVGNKNNVVLDNDKPVAGTGIYLNEDVFTVYYPTEGTDIPPKDTQAKMTERGFSAITFDSNGPITEESVYKRENINESA